MPEYQRFDAVACEFPRPRAPLFPVLRWADLGFGGGTVAPALIDGTAVRHFARGRYAMHAACQAGGIGPGSVLLAPSYHCRTMIDPALALGGTVLFYEVDSDLRPRVDSIRALLAPGDHGVKALVLPHYFGFEQPPALLAAVSAVCRHHGIMFIEDCSHAWQVAAKRAQTGQANADHVLMASPYKFFGCEDGGVLWANPALFPITPPARPGLLREIKAFTSAWSRNRAARADASDAVPRDPALRGHDIAERHDQPSPMYERAMENKNSLALSRWVMRHTRIAPLVEQRRLHYRQWLDAVAGARGGQALMPDLPDDCAPYMFPITIAEPDPVFYQLKQAGMPIFRWDDMAVSSCTVARNYRLHLLHLPCHQGLSAQQMAWMTALVAKVLA
ncbi:hypothetical protein HF313_02745 [Massilia atriviolacea]|uniref:DegT/DnrJ/EryC1/StrS aminotransferase family protein n=1 Tax=Massilia atriviolacea TaxID=2495579 RepID=A0A430HP76_9BURK|nr:DegT/DnrJ/EryC1/StrS family aminotransferase [Massilia atriviolacea]RSZ59324.1 DegT/DnrJ/EryC1/StrS aminotransferase family protein [Massilia atriviolacea]